MTKKSKFKLSIRNCKKKHSYKVCKSCKENCNGKIHYSDMYSVLRDLNKRER